jgi:hypothetical protein
MLPAEDSGPHPSRFTLAWEGLWLGIGSVSMISQTGDGATSDSEAVTGQLNGLRQSTLSSLVEQHKTKVVERPQENQNSREGLLDREVSDYEMDNSQAHPG